MILRFKKCFDITKDFEDKDLSFELIKQLKQFYQELQDCIKNSVDTFDAETAEHFIKALNRLHKRRYSKQAISSL